MLDSSYGFRCRKPARCWPGPILTGRRRRQGFMVTMINLHNFIHNLTEFGKDLILIRTMAAAQQQTWRTAHITMILF